MEKGKYIGQVVKVGGSLMVTIPYHYRIIKNISEGDRIFVTLKKIRKEVE